MLRAVLVFASLSGAWRGQPALAQVTYEPTRTPPSANDVDEVEELPPALSPWEESAEGSGTAARGEVLPEPSAASLYDELKLSQEELRSRFSSLAAVAVGSARPWQSYSLEMGSLLRRDLVASMFVGGGGFGEAGILDERAYDVKGSSRCAGFSARYFSSQFQNLSVEGLIGYAAWEGRVVPHGADEDADETADNKLASGFHATGVFAGVAFGMTWLWEGGLFLEWTPVGVRWSRMLQTAYDRDNVAVDKAVSFAVERSAFYGLTNLRLGYLF